MRSLKHAIRLHLILSAILLNACATKEEISDAEKENHILTDLLHKTYLDSNLTAKYYQSEIALGLWVTKSDMMYFFLHEDEDTFPLLHRMLIDSSQIEWSPYNGEPGYWDGIKLKPTNNHLFRTPSHNIKPWKHRLGLYLSTERRDLSWSLIELYDARYHSDYYDLPPYVYDPQYNLHFINHAKYISKADNPFLRKFIDHYYDPSMDTVDLVNTLLHFITDSIDYIYSDYYYNTDIAMYPYETLISCRGDCSAKSVLLASFLENLDIPYLLLFYPNHLLVAIDIDLGDSSSHPLYYSHEGHKYYIAETTVPGFQIGLGIAGMDARTSYAEVYQSFSPDSVMYFQDPHLHPRPINASTEDTLMGIDEEDAIGIYH